MQIVNLAGPSVPSEGFWGKVYRFLVSRYCFCQDIRDIFYLMFKAQAFHDFMGKNFVSKRLRHFSIADVPYGRSKTNI